eukprot:CAMPEP_0196162748 /NCGR_PEP_ID=MMETSP0910-20130528/47991_1 /TAXON_ID=49265 /ORGANISM="Thalassiosira rotula, Strain GSO102" /LENGTH=390 /DNA_ID=CAMNT_0041427701 /DNA_START=276 /DNA_END=1448 /DNA_ORIENTATION=-
MSSASDNNDESMSPPHREPTNINSNSLAHQLLETLQPNENEHLAKIKEAYSKKFELERDIQNFIRESYAKKKELEQDIQKFIDEESILSSSSDLANFSQSLQSDINQLETIKSSLVRKNDLQQDILRRKREPQREIELLQRGGRNITDARSMTHEDDTGPTRKRRRDEKEENRRAESSNGGGRSGPLQSSSMRKRRRDEKEENRRAESSNGGGRSGPLQSSSMREAEVDVPDADLQSNAIRVAAADPASATLAGGEECAAPAATTEGERKRAEIFARGAIRTKEKVSDKDLPILEKIAENWQKVGRQPDSVRLDVVEALFNKVCKADIARFIRFSVYSEESEPWDGISKYDNNYLSIYSLVKRIENAWKNGDLEEAIESRYSSERHSEIV